MKFGSLIYILLVLLILSPIVKWGILPIRERNLAIHEMERLIRELQLQIDFKNDELQSLYQMRKQADDKLRKLQNQ
jgi:hypothetical protein